MAQFRKFTESVQTFVVSLPEVTTLVELEKAIHSIKESRNRIYGQEDMHDDTFMVRSSDDGIRLEFSGTTTHIGGH